MRLGAARSAGFTMMEIMVVVVILGTVLMIVPTNMSSFGAQSRLEVTGNMIVAAVAGAREQAIFQGHEVALQVAMVETDDGKVPATRMKYINRGQAGGPRGDEDDEEYVEEEEELEWIYSDWSEFRDGVALVGVSIAHNQWAKVGDSRPFEIIFGPDGSVSGAVGIRIESEDLDDVAKEYRTYTVLVNALTSEATNYEGLVELPKTRDASDFR